MQSRLRSVKSDFLCKRTFVVFLTQVQPLFKKKPKFSLTMTAYLTCDDGCPNDYGTDMMKKYEESK